MIGIEVYTLYLFCDRVLFLVTMTGFSDCLALRSIILFPPLHAVGSVCRIGQLQVEQLELFRHPFHVRVVLFGLVEYQVPLPVERFQVRLDTCGLVGLLLLVPGDVQ